MTTPRTSFETSGGWLQIRAQGREPILLKPDGLDVLDLIPDEQTASAYVLLEAPSGRGRIRNLIRVASDGSVMWRAELPSGDPTDSFVALESRPDRALLAWTWSGAQVTIDTRNGHLQSWNFTK